MSSSMEQHCPNAMMPCSPSAAAPSARAFYPLDDRPFVNFAEVDLNQLVNFLFGVETFQTITGIVFFMTFFRGVGTILAGLLYNLALASSSGAARTSLEALGTAYFNSQNVATQAVMSFTAWFLYSLGRLVVNLFIDGPDRTIQGIRSQTPLEVLQFLFSPSGAGNFVTQITIDFVAAVAGWLLLSGLGQVLFGSEGPQVGGRRKKREALLEGMFSQADPVAAMESNFNRIVAGIGE